METTILEMPINFHFSLMLTIPIIINITPKKNNVYGIDLSLPDIKPYIDKAITIIAAAVASILSLSNAFTPCC